LAHFSGYCKNRLGAGDQVLNLSQRFSIVGMFTILASTPASPMAALSPAVNAAVLARGNLQREALLRFQCSDHHKYLNRCSVAQRRSPPWERRCDSLHELPA